MENKKYLHHVRAQFLTELSDTQLEALYGVIENLIPDKLTTTEAMDGGVAEESEILYHVKDGMHSYDFPTTRDLSYDETKTIFETLQSRIPIDFNIEATVPTTELPETQNQHFVGSMIEYPINA